MELSKRGDSGKGKGRGGGDFVNLCNLGTTARFDLPQKKIASMNPWGRRELDGHRSGGAKGGERARRRTIYRIFINYLHRNRGGERDSHHRFGRIQGGGNYILGVEGGGGRKHDSIGGSALNFYVR